MKLSPLIKNKSKKGNIVVMLWFFIILFVIMFIGFMMATGSSIINWVMDETVPELTEFGTVEGTNLTAISELVITPVNSTIQSFTFLTGVLYVMMLIGSIGFALVFKLSPSRWLIGFWFLLTLVLILGSIFISNIYEDFYTGDDDLSSRLKEHQILSFLLLHSPLIFTVITFATGIVLFSGIQEEFV